MRFNFGSRLRKLESIARDRLAAAAARLAVEASLAEAASLTEEASLAEESELPFEELRQRGPQAVTPVDLHTNRGGPVIESEEYRRLYAHYRRMSLLELMRLYPILKRRQRAHMAQRRRDAEGCGEHLIAEMKKSFDACARHEAAYRESERWQQDNACNSGERAAARVN